MTTPSGKTCTRCNGSGHYFDSDGHGGQSWKRPCPCRSEAPFTPAQEALLGYMFWWSEEYESAGWLTNLEKVMVGDRAYDWLVEQAGGTFIAAVGPRGVQFVPA